MLLAKNKAYHTMLRFAYEIIRLEDEWIKKPCRYLGNIVEHV